MDVLLPALIGFLFIIGVVTLVGHGIWVLLAAMFGRGGKLFRFGRNHHRAMRRKGRRLRQVALEDGAASGQDYYPVTHALGSRHGMGRKENRSAPAAEFGQ